MYPSSKEKIEETASVSYSLVMKSLMYAMVGTRPNIAYLMSTLS